MHVSQQDELPIAGVVEPVAPPESLARLLEELQEVEVDDFRPLLEREMQLASTACSSAMGGRCET